MAIIDTERYAVFLCNNNNVIILKLNQEENKWEEKKFFPLILSRLGMIT